MLKTIMMSWNVHHAVFSEMEEFYSDKHTASWFLLKATHRLVLVILGYLALLLIGPFVMRRLRLKCDVKDVFIILDVLHIGTSLWVFYETITNVFDSGNTFTCSPYPDFLTPTTERLGYAVGVFYCHQVFQMIDTAVIILRNKHNQLTKLHILYRLFTTSILWFTAKFYPVGYATSSIMMTSGVNVIIYSYYLAATLLGSKNEQLLILKKWLTQIQIAQAVAIIVHMGAGIFMGCDFPTPLAMHIMQHVGVLLYYLIQFYKKTYNEVENKEEEQEHTEEMKAREVKQGTEMEKEEKID